MGPQGLVHAVGQDPCRRGNGRAPTDDGDEDGDGEEDGDRVNSDGSNSDDNNSDDNDSTAVERVVTRPLPASQASSTAPASSDDGNDDIAHLKA